MSTKKIQIIGGSLGGNIVIDDTLTKTGQAADAKVAGDAINKLQEEIDSKVNAVDGMGLSTNDYTDEDKEKLANAAMMDDVNIKYTKPEGGIPESDFSVDVQNSLALANTAVQEHQDISGKLDVNAQAADSAKLNGEPANYYLDYDNLINVPTIPSIKDLETELEITKLRSDIDTKVDKVDGKGLSTNDYTDEEQQKLRDIESGANYYEHPTHSSHDLGLYKIAVDNEGHVSGATLVEKEDIVALGIPAQDTTYDEEILGLNKAIGDAENDIITNKNDIEEIQKDYLTSIDKTQLEDDIKEVSKKVEILNGEGEGSVKQSINNAFNEFATNITNDDVVNTYMELIDYAAKNGPEFAELVGKVNTIINNHVNNTENPHGVTKGQIGLANVDNTSDLEKPISNAVDEALKEKADLEHEHEIGHIDGLQDLLDELQNDVDTNSKDIKEHNHDDLYYDKEEILGLITVEEIDDICGSTQMPDVEVDLITMASKDWVQNNYQLKGNYLTDTDVSEKINIHNVATDSHNDIRLLIEDLSKDLHTLANSDDETLDQMSEVVEYIKNNSSLIEGITTKKVNVSDIIDDLVTNVSDKPLSAAQGVALKTLIDTLDSSDVSAVSYQAQSLTEEQKAQARENIGVGTSDIEISSDLTLSGVAAEAKAVGDALNNATQVERFSVQLGPNGAIGGYKTGDVIEAGTDIRVILNKLLQKVVPATYTKPTISLFNNGGTASGNVEAGSTVTPKLRASFTKNDSGGLTSIKIMQGGTSVANGTVTPLDYNGSSIVIGDNTITFTASADYSDAPVKNNNLGEESRENWFAGSTVTSSAYSITGKRQLFYGAGIGALPTITSDIVRGLNGKKLAPANGNSFNVNVAVGQQYIVIAYPKSLRDINNITYVEANDSGMAANFTKTEIQVADARGGTNGLADYKVYTYAMAVPAAAAMTFKVTI